MEIKINSNNPLYEVRQWIFVFRGKFRRSPTHIISNIPLAEKIFESMSKEYNYAAMHNLINIDGVKLIRSFDIDPDTILIF